MAESIRLVDYFYVDVPDKPGEAANVLARLKEVNVNLIAFTGFPSGKRAQLDFVPADPSAFLHAAKSAKWSVTGPKKAFLVQGQDRVGVAAEITRKLADAKINVTATTAISAGERYGMIFWVKPSDVDKAARALGVS